jgi:regulator of cell morphogenesis and NO signaling
MKISERTPVGDIVAKHPRAAVIFERRGIDYYCAGHRSLAVASEQDGADVASLLAELAGAEDAAERDRDWTTAALGELAAHIVSCHHAGLRAELPRLDAHLRLALAAETGPHAEDLGLLARLLAGLGREIAPHLDREERILFPAIERCERARHRGWPLPPTPFGSFANPIAAMERDHEASGAALRRIREAAAGYAVPEGASAARRALVTELAQLETDLHRHIHLENNILFPRALGLEASFE